MSEEQRNMILRFSVIFTLIAMGFLCVIMKIIYIQNFQKDKWAQIEKQQVKINVVTQPIRGNILDSNGNLLASSLPRFTVRMDTRVEALHLGGDTLFYKYVDSIAIGLNRIMKDKSAQEYKNVMVKAFKQKKDVCVCPRADYMQKKEIAQLPLVKRGLYKSGFYFESQHRRSKPFESLGSRTIGNIYAESGIGNAGLEKQYESYLHGKSGVSIRRRIAGHMENVPVEKAEDGCDIITTFDANLMDICESALRRKLEQSNAEWGCCILMETSTGQIKAISNLDRTSDGGYAELANHAVMRVEPGSTFKTIAMMAALDDGKKDINDTIEVYRNGWNYNGSRHTDAHPKDTVYTLRSALAVSSNIAFAKIVTESYERKAEKFVNKLRKMGICDSVWCEIPGAAKPRIDIPNDAVTLSKMSYGYSVELSPMHLLTFYNGIANDGKMIRPYMVKEIRKNGHTIKSFDTEVLNSSMCKASTLKDIQSALHDVVWDNQLGTASINPWGMKKAQSELVHIAGKTGTAQLFMDGRYHGNMHRMTFVGYFPEEHPEYTCICMINHPTTYGYDAGMDCGTVVKQVAEKTMAYAGEYVIQNHELVWKRTK